MAYQGEFLLPEIRVTDDEMLRRREETLFHTERAWNVLLGCKAVSEGCRSCQAAARLDHHNANSGRTVDWSKRDAPLELDQALTEPAMWKTPQRVMIAPMSDLFQPSVSRTFIERVLKVVAAHPQHVFMVTTRHPRRLREILQAHPAPPNLAVGVAAEDQATFEERVPFVLDIVARWRYLVLEPLLSAIDVNCLKLPSNDLYWPLQGIVQGFAGFDARQQPQWHPKSQPVRQVAPLDWIVVGGERGAAPRPAHPAWVRAIRDASLRQGRAFFFRGWGDFVPTRRPDPRNPRLLVVSESGQRRSIAASAELSEVAEDEMYFTPLARGDEPIQFFLDGQRHFTMPELRAQAPQPAASDNDVLERELQRLTPRMAAAGGR